MGKARIRALLTVLMIALGALVALTAAPSSSAAAAVRIMPLGDSITGSPGCWRALLWNRLQTSGHTDVDFVGTLPPQGCSVAHDGDNEGHGGELATNVADQNLLPGRLSATRPDVVLMHLGTNDVWSNRPTSTILSAFTTLTGQMRAANPAMRILVAQIIPMNPSSCPDCAQRAVALNNALPAWANATTTPQSPITVVDQWTGFSTAADTYDGVHPNAAGDQKISDRWYPALTAALGSTPTPTPTPTPSPTGCTLTIVNQWSGGFQATITVTNPGPSPVTAWRAAFELAGTWAVSSSWSGVWTRTGTTVTVANAPWNGALGPNATATAGFVASGSGPLPATCSTA